MKGTFRILSSLLLKSDTFTGGAKLLVLGLLADAGGKLLGSVALAFHAKAAAFIAALAPRLEIPLIGSVVEILTSTAASLAGPAVNVMAAGTLVALAGKILICAGLVLAALSLFRFVAGIMSVPRPADA